MQNATTVLMVTPKLCQYRDKPAHVVFSVGKYRRQSKSAALGFTNTVSQAVHDENTVRKGWSRAIYNIMGFALVACPIALYQTHSQ